MSIINGQRNQKGIQRLGTEWSNNRISADSCLVRHTNGRMYAIFARDYLNAVIERRLYATWSSDGGVTWSAEVELTSGFLDDQPTALQLDLNDTASVIGIVYRSSNVVTSGGAAPTVLMRRITIDVSGVRQTPMDSLGANTGAYAHPSLVRIASGFMVIAHDLQPNTIVRYSTNTVFTNNSWTAFAQLGPQNFFGAATNQILHLHAFNLASSHIGVVGCVRTSLDGSTSASANALDSTMGANVRTDVFAAFTSDEGVNWGTPQNLTNYTGTPGFDLVGIDSAVSAKAVELSDGNVAIAFQESKGGQVCNASTSLSFPAGYGQISAIVYNAAYNYLFVGVSTTGGTGGLLVYDLTNQTSTIINTSSTPAIWSNNVKDLALSADGTYLAVGSDQSLDIIYMPNSTISGWTVTGLRTTSTPSIRVNNIAKVMFDSSGYNLYASFATSTGVNGVWGLLVDASNPVAVSDLVSGSVTLVASDFFVAPSKVYVLTGSGGSIGATNKTTGAALYNTAFSGTSFTVGAYDDVNGEIIAVVSATGGRAIRRYTDSGSAFALDAGFFAFNATSPGNPTCYARGGGTYRMAGIGVIFTYAPQSGYYVTDFYSFGDRSLVGSVIVPSYTDQNIPFTRTHNQISRPIKGGAWLPFFYQDGMAFAPITNIGRLRWGVFSYNSGTEQLGASDFYDALNLLRFDSTTPYNLREFGMERDANDQLYFTPNRFDLRRSTDQIVVLNGYIEPDAYKAYAQARILNSYTQTVQGKARVQVSTEGTVNARGRIVLAVCVQAKARIVPVVTQTVSAKAKILSAKQTALNITYDKVYNSFYQVKGSFWVTGAKQRVNAAGAKARIARVVRKTIVGSFISVIPSAGTVVALNVNGAEYGQRSVQIKGSITHDN